MEEIKEFSEEIERLSGRIGEEDLVLVLGGTDTGKTTFVRGLYAELGGEVIDADPGQPRIGPPGLISFGDYRNGMKDAHFVGDFTPRGKLVQTVTGTAMMIRNAESRCFVDTDGWIDGEGAEVHKSELIALTDPDQLVLLQEETELEKFSSFLPPERVFRVDAAHGGRKTSGERAANRIRDFKYYFSKSERVESAWNDIRVGGKLLGTGQDFPLEKLRDHLEADPIRAWKTGDRLTVLTSGSRGLDRTELERELGMTEVECCRVEDLQHRLVGCYHRGEFAGLGTITGIGKSGLEILTEAREFDLVKLGEKKVKPTGRPGG